MSKILGIIAEYDPFHRGHLRHLQLAKEAVQPEYTWVALSGCFKQRGEISMFSPYDRARCALTAGADAVFALPAAWTVREAEHYALGAVSMLRDLGITHLAFGAEEKNLDFLQRIAVALESSSPAFQMALHNGLKAGLGYPRAMTQAVESVLPGAGAVLNRPNNILAICYLRAIRRLEANITPVLISRSGDYHAEYIDPMEPSASAIRGALIRGTYGNVRAAVPEYTQSMIQRAFLDHHVPDTSVLDHLLLHRLRGMTREELAALPDVSEGLEDRIQKAAKQANTREELLDLACGKRYPRARISRICAWALLGESTSTLPQKPLPEQAVLLALRKRPEMTALWREGKLQVESNFTDSTDLLAWKIWAQCTHQPDTLPQTERLVTIF